MADTKKDIKKDIKKVEEIVNKGVLAPGQKVKTVTESPFHDKTETVPGIREGKVGKYGVA